MSCDFLAMAAPGVRNLMPYQPGKPESELRRELGLSNIIKLASNENPLGPGAAAAQAAAATLSECARYPDGNGHELKSALAAHHGVDVACITLGNGSNDVLELLARAFCTPADQVLFSAHAFAVYPLVAQAVGAEAVVAPALGADQAMPYGHDLAAMADRIGHRTRLIFVANPNNPTGTWIDAATLEAFVSVVPETCLVVVDEAYTQYAESCGVSSALDWLTRFPNLVVTRTFSKAYGLAGLRVGYSVSRPEVADLMNRVRQPFNVNLPAQAAATAALADTAHLARSVELNNVQRARLTEAGHERGLDSLPSAANFLCLDMGRTAQPIFQAMLKRGVIVRPVANYGLPNHLRVTVGTEPENTRFIQVLDEALTL
jgi:histidinol-phosphate aminotransferase